MKTLNTMPVEQLAGCKYSCECGDTHSVSTKYIVFRENAYAELPVILEQISGKGSRVLVIYSKSGMTLKEKIEGRLGDFVLETTVIESNIPDVVEFNRFAGLSEDVRVLIAVGGGALVDTVKFVAASLKRKCIVVPDVIKSDAFLSPSCVVYRDGFKEIYRSEAPVALVADFDTLLAASETDTAAAFGNISAKNIALFDWKFSSVITGEKYCAELGDLALSITDGCLNLRETLKRRERSASLMIQELNIRSGLYMQLAGSTRLSCGGETHLEHALEMLFLHEKRVPKNYGENVMLCAAFLSRVYKSALARTFGNLLYPPDNNLRAETLVEYLGAEPTAALTKVRPLPEESVLRARRYALREYRDELYADICAAADKTEQAYRAFRRLYTDGGYGLVNYLDASDLRITLPLAPDIREKFTLLTMLKDMGLLDEYLGEIDAGKGWA